MTTPESPTPKEPESFGDFLKLSEKEKMCLVGPTPSPEEVERAMDDRPRTCGEYEGVNKTLRSEVLRLREELSRNAMMLADKGGRCAECTGHKDPWVRESAYLAVKAALDEARKKITEARAEGVAVFAEIFADELRKEVADHFSHSVTKTAFEKIAHRLEVGAAQARAGAARKP